MNEYLLYIMFVTDAPMTGQLKEATRDELPNGLTKLSLVCNSDVSNPSPNITWTGLKNIQKQFKDLDERPGQFGGYQVSQVSIYVEQRSRLTCTQTPEVLSSQAITLLGIFLPDRD